MRTFLILVTLVATLVSCATSDDPRLGSGIDPTTFDSDVRPQDDFNAYVNGGWIRNTEIPADQGAWGAFNILRQASDERQRAIIEDLANRPGPLQGDEQRIGDFYASFMDTARLDQLGVTPVRASLESILNAQSSSELLGLGVQLYRRGISIPLGLYVDQDNADATRYLAYLSQSGLTLPNRDYYFNKDAKFGAMRDGLSAYATKLFGMAGVDRAEVRGRRVLEVETRIAEHHWLPENVRDVRKTYNIYSGRDLNTLTRGIDWNGYLNGMGVSPESQVIVRMPSYFTSLGRLMREISLDDWKTYYAFHLLNDSAEFLSDDFVQAHFQFNGQLVGGRKELLPRWQRGTQLINGMMGEAVGRVYVERHFSPDAKARVEKLVQNLMDAFGDAIRESEWMTEETRARAESKRSQFTYKIGYPNQWRDYSSMTIRRDDLAGNVERATEFEYERNLRKLGQPVDRAEWFMTPQTINAYHNYNMNEIVFPAAILQPPFFNMEADDAVNYGGIGAVIGHEIGHAFDDQGRNFDGSGNMKNWWSDEDDRRFRERADRLVTAIGRYEPIKDMRVNGRLTLGENIGDLTGVTIAYRAYQKSLQGKEAPVIDGFTGAQRFFIGYGQIWRSKLREEVMRQRLLTDSHSPPEIRLNGILPHVPMFYDAFALKEGDGMWLAPEERIRIW